MLSLSLLMASPKETVSENRSDTRSNHQREKPILCAFILFSFLVMANLLSVTILIELSSSIQTRSAQDLEQLLKTTYGVPCIQIRSCRLPTERLLKSGTRLFVGLSSADTPLYAGLRSESPQPILILSNATPDEAALETAKVLALVSDEIAACVAAQIERQKTTSAYERQLLLADDAKNVTTRYVEESIAVCYDTQSQVTGDKVQDINQVQRFRGKVRDRWEKEGCNTLAMVTTDRQSGFDRQLAVVPFKGAVLNLCSAYWFSEMADIIPNHLISIPHPSVAIVRRCEPFPIEFVVRSYMTGSTSTSIWKNYQNGVRTYCGHELPDGMTKNQKLPKNLLTPTTKEEEHDRPISVADIVSENHMTASDLDVCAKAALAIFARGQSIAAEHGLILVDTKYEFGRCSVTGEILLIDEVHTPDSSRYWLASSAAQRIAEGKEPENIDKEFLRLWFRDQCDPYKDETIPEPPRDLVLELSRRYIQLYEMITWKDFDFAAAQRGEDMISAVLKDVFDPET